MSVHLDIPQDIYAFWISSLDIRVLHPTWWISGGYPFLYFIQQVSGRTDIQIPVPVFSEEGSFRSGSGTKGGTERHWKLKKPVLHLTHPPCIIARVTYLWILMSICWSLGWSVGWYVCHNCLEGQEVTLTFSYRSTNFRRRLSSAAFWFLSWVMLSLGRVWLVMTLLENISPQLFHFWWWFTLHSSSAAPPSNCCQNANIQLGKLYNQFGAIKIMSH